MGEFSLLVQPPNNYYWEQSIKTHHITPDLTEKAPHFNMAWHRIESLITNQDIVAVNSTLFDCLKQTLEFYKLALPDYTTHSIEDIFKQDINSLRKRYSFVPKANDVMSVAESCALLLEFAGMRK